MKHAENMWDTVDFGPDPYVINIACATKKNPFFRRAIWTGCHLQVTLMCIPPCGEIGLEIHPETDQFLRVEQGRGIVLTGKCREVLEQQPVCQNSAIFIPAGTWHNLVNTGAAPLKLYSIYAPPQHPHGVVHRTKAESDAAGD